MRASLQLFWRFILGSLHLIVRGPPLYFAWVAFLLVIIVVGGLAWAEQLQDGLIRTNLRDPVSWGFYIGNFTFLVGVAAAAVVLVIPAYLYHWKPIKEVVIVGELLAISAILMCMLFVTVDIGRPDRFWHLLPFIGNPNFPSSLLSWDVLVLNGYFLLNFTIATHILFRWYNKRAYSKRFALPLILCSIPAAVSIHTVTAFLYSGLVSRPYWNSAILAPRFLASAFCSGPAIILVVLQLMRYFTTIKIPDKALFKIAELMAYAMFVSLFLMGAEIFREYYSHTHHIVHHAYLFFGNAEIAAYAWFSLIASVIAFFLFLIPKTRMNLITLNIGAVLIYMGVYIEKGVALVVPGFTPSVLGEVYEYGPSWVEIKVSAGIFGVGFLAFTMMLKIAIPIMMGDFNIDIFRSKDLDKRAAEANAALVAARAAEKAAEKAAKVASAARGKAEVARQAAKAADEEAAGALRASKAYKASKAAEAHKAPEEDEVFAADEADEDEADEKA